MGPIAIFDEEDNVFIISHLTNFMGASYSYDSSRTQMNVCPLGQAEKVPKGFSIKTIGVYGNKGINNVSTFISMIDF